MPLHRTYSTNTKELLFICHPSTITTKFYLPLKVARKIAKNGHWCRDKTSGHLWHHIRATVGRVPIAPRDHNAIEWLRQGNLYLKVCPLQQILLPFLCFGIRDGSSLVVRLLTNDLRFLQEKWPLCRQAKVRNERGSREISLFRLSMELISKPPFSIREFF